MSDKKKRPPYLLIVLLPLLGVGIWLLFADRQARDEAQAAYDLLNEHIAEYDEKVMKDDERSTPDQVHQMMKTKPAGPLYEKGNYQVEEYHYPGGLKSFVLYVAYQPKEPPEPHRLHEIQLNDPF